LAQLEAAPAELVITDLRMPGIGGMEFLRRLKDTWPDTEVVVMTAYGSIDTAVEAMRCGAYDYLTKPIDRERFPIVVDKALERHALTTENKQLRDRLETRMRFDQMVGESEPMQRVYSLVEMVAASDVTVLLTGETGTGKELVARAIHHKSPRADGPFITVNCGALPENLFESELFGYEKGAFTGAMATKMGRFELADGGTLLLDEVGELSLKSQVDFLRVLETKEFRRLGGTKLLKVDTRIIAAAIVILKKRSSGRVSGRPTTGSMSCPFASRRSVIARTIFLLVDWFLAECSAQHHREPKDVTRPCGSAVHVWPETFLIRNLMERLVVT
jgi:DNA-binding NtrC family response regulator